MTDLVFDVALGRALQYVQEGGSLVTVPLEAASLDSDDILRRQPTLAAVLTGSSNEQTTMGRRVLTGVLIGTGTLNADAPVWAEVTGNAVGALVICYSPTTATGDGDLIPLVKFDVSLTPDGSGIGLQFGTDGFYQAQAG